ncbi:MAG: hypothetical protein HY287_14290 [Planctomycetes bacterium]|nr:hypothetical protein [Planctomycetota bacterium]MBI3835493.1 hypothetical protein [Planctomycetota bacterium]
MTTASTIDTPDPAAVFGAAISLWNTCRRYDRRSPVSIHCAHLDRRPSGGNQRRPDGVNLSETYNGMDEFMRVVMKVANLFEDWACKHIEFDETEEVWPYLLEDKFGEACLAVMRIEMLDHFDEEACLAAAIQLRLPIKLSKGLHVQVDVKVTNPVSGSAFREFRIQTVRVTSDLESVEPYVVGDYPYDDNYGEPYFGIFGVDNTGLLEHITDRGTYGDAVALVQKLAPNACIPTFPNVEPAHDPAINREIID